MHISQMTNTERLVCLDIEQLPVVNFDPIIKMSKQIASHLKDLLEQYGTGYPISLKVPSIMDLSAFYNQDSSKVLEALFELQLDQYDYIMHSTDQEIILMDPLNRKHHPHF